MGKILVITEKPSVAREYAQILSVTGGKRDGYIDMNLDGEIIPMQNPTVEIIDDAVKVILPVKVEATV